MRQQTNQPPLDSIPAVSFPVLLSLLGAAALGALAAAGLLPVVAPGLAASLLGPEPKAYWYLARSSAWVAYLLLWGSMLMGLSITTKAARVWPGGPAAYDIHQFISLLSLAFALFHGLILTGDRYINFSVAQVFVPFSNPAYRPLWVGIGQVAFYIIALVGLSFYARRRLTPRVWRLIHYLSFAAFGFVFLHAAAGGTDSGQPWAVLLYLVSGASVFFLTLYRILFAAADRLLKLIRETA